MCTKLTKNDLRTKVKVGEIIIEKMFNLKTYNKVKSITEDSMFVRTLHLEELVTKKKKKLIISGNFNKEGDRRYKSPNGNVIVNYFKNKENV